MLAMLMLTSQRAVLVKVDVVDDVVPSQRSGSTCSGSSHARRACSQSIVTQPSTLRCVGDCCWSLLRALRETPGAGVGVSDAVGVGGSGPAQSARTEIDRQQACEHLLHAGPWRCRRSRERQTRHQSQA